MSFGQIAHVYDRFNDLSVYEYWLDFTLNSRDTQPKSVLDLACGTGLMTDILAPFSTEITGLDIDPDMLSIAQAEAGHLENVTFVQGDMMDLSFAAESFDLILCYFDSLCFLASYDEVVKSFSEAYRVLEEGGAYLFDVWTLYQVNQVFADFQYFDYDEEAALLWESEVDANSNTVEHFLTIFESQDGKNYHRHDVVLREQTYPLKMYIAGLLKAGFKLENIYAYIDYGRVEYASQDEFETERWFFRCFK